VSVRAAGERRIRWSLWLGLGGSALLAAGGAVGLGDPRERATSAWATGFFLLCAAAFAAQIVAAWRGPRGSREGMRRRYPRLYRRLGAGKRRAHV